MRLPHGFEQELAKRSLDAAVKAMTRNRTLLFTLNVIAAIILITVYLERQSVDARQRERHLCGLADIRQELRELGVPTDIMRETDPDRIDVWTWEILDRLNMRLLARDLSEKTQKQYREAFGRWRAKVSTAQCRLRRLRNDMNRVTLPGGEMLPVGISVPRNDIVPISGIILLLLYSWFCLSFRQLAGIIERIRDIFIGSTLCTSGRGDLTGPSVDPMNREEIEERRIMLRTILELHYMFRTSKKGLTRWLVKILYYLPPIAMLSGLVNDYYSVILQSRDWQLVLRQLVRFRLLFSVGLVVGLIFVAIEVTLADRAVNVASFGREMLDNG